jgi:hypothetical protein
MRSSPASAKARPQLRPNRSDLHDPAVIAGLAETFYLSEFVNTPTAQRIAAAIQTRYQHNADEEWPDAYYDDLTAAYDRLLRCALELNEPVKAAA